MTEENKKSPTIPVFLTKNIGTSGRISPKIKRWRDIQNYQNVVSLNLPELSTREIGHFRTDKTGNIIECDIQLQELLGLNRIDLLSNSENWLKMFVHSGDYNRIYLDWSYSLDKKETFFNYLTNETESIFMVCEGYPYSENGYYHGFENIFVRIIKDEFDSFNSLKELPQRDNTSESRRPSSSELRTTIPFSPRDQMNTMEWKGISTYEMLHRLSITDDNYYGHYRADITGMIVVCDEHAENILGLKIEDMKGGNGFKNIMKDDLSRVHNLWFDCIENKTKFFAKYRVIHSQNIHYCVSEANPIIWDSKILGFEGIIAIVTEQIYESITLEMEEKYSSARSVTPRLLKSRGKSKLERIICCNCTDNTITTDISPSFNPSAKASII